MHDSPNITSLLIEWKDGNQSALAELVPLVYDELHRQAARYLRKEDPGHTLQATALINEAYLRLIDQTQVDWQGRNHFFAVASTTMRRILVDHARSRRREKRGGGAVHVPIEDVLNVIPDKAGVDLIAVDDALRRLETHDQRQAKVVELRYFCGLSIVDTAAVLELSTSTVRAEWTLAKAWLKAQLA
ncbi:MAG TPA: sigma-70 family RNA polymerase sigma factor [Pyrinomonadaceae bacterium]|nr:sigma-70 family RNA polymerase sigma factor [Pyrinomonadaceae bacterium]